MADPARNLDEPHGQGASDAVELALVQQPQTLTESQSAVDATPNFNNVFRAKLLRRAFKATKRRCAKTRPCQHQELHCLRTKKFIKTQKCCKSKWCFLKNTSDISKFLAKVAVWRVNWKVTPRQAKRDALLHHLHALKSKSQQSQQSSTVGGGDVAPSTIGGGDVARWAGHEVISLPGQTPIKYAFLGHSLCKGAFETCLLYTSPSPRD